MVDEKEVENEEVIDEDELEDLLEEVKGEPEEKESEETNESGEEGEIEIELEPETQEEGEKAEIGEKELMEGEIKPEAIQLATAPTIQPQSGLVEPVCSIEKAIEIFKKFEEAKRKILSENDIMWIGDDGRPTAKGQGTPYIKRSGWRKLARFFGLSWDVESVNKTKMENGGYMYRARVKVWHPSGASVTAEGAATSEDKFFTKGGRKEADEADVLMKAETVAINRVISDILGSGEVSEEETE
ncbi:MAG: hypothetical protein DRP18_05095 [Candidatus Aenigmatarchaeota archaeon]|nr:MAG: hypothetical protein DRP18_05095 [Candidatus Aenigmarchaeota archaeon]